VIHIFAERDTVELVERGLVEPFTDAVRLRALGLGVRVTTEQKIIRAKVGLLELVKQLGNVSVKLLRVLTDRGSEFCGNPERHDYGLYLAVEEIHHSRSKTKSPQTRRRAGTLTGFCGDFLHDLRNACAMCRSSAR
jgi:hypothetical protein